MADTPWIPDEKDYYDVPAGTPGTPCRLKDCERTKFMVPSRKTPGKWVPIDCDVPGGQRPTATEDGRGVSHFKTCKRPDVFSRREPKQLTEEQHAAREQREMIVDHKVPACIMCGCTQLKPCLLTIAEAGLEGEEIPLGEDDQPVQFVGCGWICLDPPVCSAPACAQRFEELPLKVRVKRIHKEPATA